MLRFSESFGIPVIWKLSNHCFRAGWANRCEKVDDGVSFISFFVGEIGYQQRIRSDAKKQISERIE